MAQDQWPIPPFHVEDYPVLLALLGPEEFGRIVCPLAEARRRWQDLWGPRAVLDRGS